MRNYIFQLSASASRIDQVADATEIEGGEMAIVDFAYPLKSNQISSAIDDLVNNILPKGMVSIKNPGVLIYNGGFREWKSRYYRLLQEKMADINEDNIMQWIGPAYQLQKALFNPLDTDALFITCGYGDNFGVAERSAELMRMLEILKPGDPIYIVQVLGYGVDS